MSEVLAGKYQLIDQLGQGGMGSVWRARHLSLGSHVAVKLIDPVAASNAEMLARFNREARAAAALRSPHVVQVLDHGVDQGTPFIVMELLEGESLGKRLEQRCRLSPAEVARVVTHVARAMTRAHDAGIVHRDLKPDNVFLVRNDDDEMAKVLDFGIAKGDVDVNAPASASTRTGALLGTPYYMSPEQVMGERTIDFRTDIWSLSVIAFECLTGRKPFDAASMGALLVEICTKPLPVPSSLAAVPAGFDAWFGRGCARNREGRFQSAKQAASELLAVCGALPTSQPFSTPGQQLGETIPMSTLPVSVPLTLPGRLGSTTGQLSHSSDLASPSGAGAESRKLWLALGLTFLGVTAAGLWWAKARASNDAAPASVAPTGLPSTAVEAPSAIVIAPDAPSPDLGVSAAPRSAASAASPPSAAPGPKRPPRAKTAPAADAPAPAGAVRVKPSSSAPRPDLGL